ncbi:MAG TPA: ABC transporter ATP-binding protein [Methylomirabilota bacterium]|nr:ABC transporter ATP-binding protein [Methylomirabilota bacterium]
MIHLEHVTKRFGSFTAVNDLSLQIAEGEIFGFLGPNGAGKTTTIRMMMGLLRPSAGRILLGGHDLATAPLAAKAISAFVPDRPFVYEKLTGREFLEFVGRLYQVPEDACKTRAIESLEFFRLSDWGDELVETYSHGMKQRLVVAAALLPDPRILVVDEPMVGMDPIGARMFKALLRSLTLKGKTVFMSTHSLEVAEELCDRIGIILSGRLIALGTLDELQQQAGREGRLEDIFLQLTAAPDMLEVIEVLRA